VKRFTNVSKTRKRILLLKAVISDLNRIEHALTLKSAYAGFFLLSFLLSFYR
jgi:hypothetical protein